MTVIGIAGCTALLLTGFGLRDSIGDIVGKQFGELYQYNLTASFKDEDAPRADETREGGARGQEPGDRLPDDLPGKRRSLRGEQDDGSHPVRAGEHQPPARFHRDAGEEKRQGRAF